MCVTLLTDASNHGLIKLFPVLISYFLPYKRVKVKVLEFREQPSETSDIIFVDYLKEVLSYNDLMKVVAFYRDNTDCKTEKIGKVVTMFMLN